MSVRLGKRSKLAGISVLAIVWIPFTAPVATAHWISGATGTTDCNRLNIHDTQDSLIHYREAGISTALSDAVDWVVRNDINTTDLSSSLTTSATYQDISIHDGDYVSWCDYEWWGAGGTTIGASKCSELVRSECKWHTVAIQQGWIASTTAVKRKRLVCHEIGHSIGILHQTHGITHSCMWENPGDSIAFFSDHEVNDMINYVW